MSPGTTAAASAVVSIACGNLFPEAFELGPGQVQQLWCRQSAVVGALLRHSIE